MVYYKPTTEQTASPATTLPTTEEMNTTVVNAQPAQATTMKMEQQDAKRLRGGCGVSANLCVRC